MRIKPKRLLSTLMLAALGLAPALVTAHAAEARPEVDDRLLFRESLAAAPGPQATPPGQTLRPTTASASARLTTSYLLSWEGRDLTAFNLEALRAFRNEHPELRFVHFISPAYFLRSPDSAVKARETIRSLTRPGDGFGLLIGGWKSLATASGVIFRSSPSFWGHSLRSVDCVDDCGLEVPVHIYPDQDLEKIIAKGVEVLDQQGFGRAQALMTEGWVASPHVLEAATRLGLRYDFSAVAPELLVRRAFYYPLFAWVKGLWPQVTPHTQAYQVTTGSGRLTEVPQNIAAADYMLQEDVKAIFKEYLDRSKKDQTSEITFQIGLYQETAARILPSFTNLVTDLKRLAVNASVALDQVSLPGLELQGPFTAPVPGAPQAPVVTPIAH